MSKMDTEHEDRLHVCKLYWNYCTFTLPYILANILKTFYIFIYRLLIPDTNKKHIDIGRDVTL